MEQQRCRRPGRALHGGRGSFGGHRPIYGREAIEKHYADVFQKVHFSNHLDKPDQSSPHIIGTTGNEAWSNGQWSLTYQVKGGDPVELTGYWLEIYSREGGTWKKRVDAWNVTPAPAQITTPSPASSKQ